MKTCNLFSNKNCQTVDAAAKHTKWETIGPNNNKFLAAKDSGNMLVDGFAARFGHGGFYGSIAADGFALMTAGQAGDSQGAPNGQVLWVSNEFPVGPLGQHGIQLHTSFH
jgi:hypothetical protein